MSLHIKRAVLAELGFHVVDDKQYFTDPQNLTLEVGDQIVADAGSAGVSLRGADLRNDKTFERFLSRLTHGQQRFNLVTQDDGETGLLFYANAPDKCRPVAAIDLSLRHANLDLSPVASPEDRLLELERSWDDRVQPDCAAPDAPTGGIVPPDLCDDLHNAYDRQLIQNVHDYIGLTKEYDTVVNRIRKAFAWGFLDRDVDTVSHLSDAAARLRANEEQYQQLVFGGVE